MKTTSTKYGRSIRLLSALMIAVMLIGMIPITALQVGASENSGDEIIISDSDGVRIYDYDENGWNTNRNGWNHDSPSGRYFGHLGVDYTSRGSRDIRAIADGKVVYSERTEANGNTVTIEHNINGVRFYSFYSHMKEDTRIEKGKIVGAGDKIGVVGETGYVTGEHVHLGIYTGELRGDQYGYNKENGKNAKFDDKGNGYWEFGGNTFYDPQKFFSEKGKNVFGEVQSYDTLSFLKINSPLNNAENLSTNGINVNWTKIDNADEYRIAVRDITYGNDTTDDADALYIVPSNITTYNVKNLTYNGKDNGQLQPEHKYKIWVCAYDSSGNPVSLGDSVKVTLAAKATEEKPNTEIPTTGTVSRDIVLILDGSGSMSSYEFSMTKQAAEAFATQLMNDSANTNIAVMSFGSSNTLFKINDSDTGFYNTLDEVKNVIAAGDRDRGSTYMADALLYAEELLENSTADRQVIMLMSDGSANDYSSEAASYGTKGDFVSTPSNVTYNVAKHLVDDNGYYIYTLGFGLSSGSEAERLLKKIAELNDCTYQAVSKVEDLVFGFEENANDIILSDNQILITIACPVEVMVTHKGEMLSSDPYWYSERTGFGTLSLSKDREVKTLKLLASNIYDIDIYGTGEGKMTVTIKYPGVAKEVVVFKDVPVSPFMSATFNTGNDQNTVMTYKTNCMEEYYEEEIIGEKVYNGKTEFTLTYVSDGSVYETATYTIGDTIVLPNAPEKEGYVFAGWEGLPETMPAYDVIVNAVWEEADTDSHEPHGDMIIFPKLYKVKVSVGEGGTTNVSDSFVIAHGASRTVKITPDEGYEIADVIVNGRSVGAVETYELRGANSDHTIEIVFEKLD